MCMPILYWDKEMKISKMGTGEMIMKMKKLMLAGMLALGACGMLAGCGGGDKAASSAAKAASGAATATIRRGRTGRRSSTR